MYYRCGWLQRLNFQARIVERSQSIEFQNILILTHIMPQKDISKFAADQQHRNRFKLSHLNYEW